MRVRLDGKVNSRTWNTTNNFVKLVIQDLFFVLLKSKWNMIGAGIMHFIVSLICFVLISRWLRTEIEEQKRKHMLREKELGQVSKEVIMMVVMCVPRGSYLFLVTHTHTECT